MSPGEARADAERRCWLLALDLSGDVLAFLAEGERVEPPADLLDDASAAWAEAWREATRAVVRHLVPAGVTPAEYAALSRAERVDLSWRLAGVREAGRGA